MSSKGIGQKSNTTISTWAAMVLKTVELKGINPEHVIEKSQLDRELLMNSDARIKIEDMVRFWKAVVEITGDECFGLEVGENLRPTTVHAMGFAIMVSDTLKDGFERLERYYRIVSNSAEAKFESDGQLSWFQMNPCIAAVQPPVEAFDMAIASIVCFVRRLSNNGLDPVKVELQRVKPSNNDRFKALFKAPLKFSEENNRIYYRMKDLEQKLPDANAEIARRNDEIVIDYLERSDLHSLKHKVREKIIDLLPLGRPSISQLAQNLSMSISSLQRCLKKEEISFQEILEDVRRNLAVQYLKHPSHSIIETAFKLGYTDAANFTRAFKRWYETSPKQFRQRVLEES